MALALWAREILLVFEKFTRAHVFQIALETMITYTSMMENLEIRIIFGGNYVMKFEGSYLWRAKFDRDL